VRVGLHAQYSCSARFIDFVYSYTPYLPRLSPFSLAEINKSLRTHTLYTLYEDSENVGLLFRMAVMVFVNSTVLLDIDKFHLL